MAVSVKEGSLEKPTRHALDWKSADFYNEESLHKEMERVFDICHGCRRCVSLCTAFPTLFDLVDESSTMEVGGVAKASRISTDHQTGAYSGIFWFQFIINFLAPLLILMRRGSKRNYTTVTIMALVILFGHWLDFYQMIFASVAKEHVELG